jgi:hemolysin activation/secretion protein
VIATPARYPEFTLAYGATWLGSADPARHALIATNGARNSTTLSLSLSFLIRGLFDNAEQFSDKRYDAGPSFIMLHPSLERQQVLLFDWSLDVRIDGQIVNEPLISNEQYAAGGVDTVRGYTEAERLGDDGGHGSLELRTPELLAHWAPRVEQSYLFAFLDGARVQTLEPLPDQHSAFNLASYGVGLRFKLAGLSADVDGAHAVTSGYVTKRDGNSVQFRVSYAH